MIGFLALSSINLWLTFCDLATLVTSVSAKLHTALGPCTRQYLSLKIPAFKFLPAYFF